MGRAARYAVLKGVSGQLIQDPRKPLETMAYAGMKMVNTENDDDVDFVERFEPVPQLFKYSYDLQRLVKKGSLELVGKPFTATSMQDAAAKMTKNASEEHVHGTDRD